MRKRRVYLMFVVLVVAGVLVAVFGTRDREPEYGGKRLSEWVDKCAPPAGAIILRDSVILSNPPPTPFRAVSLRSAISTDSRKALHSIGSNGVPFLLKWIQYKPPAWRTKLLTIISKTFQFAATPDHDQIRRAHGAELALIELGSEAEGAVPSLASWMYDANAPARASRATIVLFALRDTVFTAAMALMSNSASSVRLEGINALAHSGSPLNPAVPFLIQRLDDPDPETAKAAAEMLGIGRVEARLAVPALVKSLPDKRLIVRKAALSALGRFRREARPAIPAVAALLKDPDHRTRILAADVLDDIDRGAWEKPTAR